MHASTILSRIAIGMPRMAIRDMPLLFSGGMGSITVANSLPSERPNLKAVPHNLLSKDSPDIFTESISLSTGR